MRVEECGVDIPENQLDLNSAGVDRKGYPNDHFITKGYSIHSHCPFDLNIPVNLTVNREVTLEDLTGDDLATIKIAKTRLLNGYPHYCKPFLKCPKNLIKSKV